MYFIAQIANQQQQLDALASRRQAAMQPQAAAMVRRQDDDSDGEFICRASRARQLGPNVHFRGAEESARVTTRALAVTRFKRNHELLAEVFAVNAVGEWAIRPRFVDSDVVTRWYVANAKVIPSPYEKVDQAELEAKLVCALLVLVPFVHFYLLLNFYRLRQVKN